MSESYGTLEDAAHDAIAGREHGFHHFRFDPDLRPAIKQLIKLTPEGKPRKAIQDMLDVPEHPKGAAIRSLMFRRMFRRRPDHDEYVAE